MFFFQQNWNPFLKTKFYSNRCIANLNIWELLYPWKMKVFPELPNDVIYYILNFLNHQDRTAVLVAFSDEFSIREPLWKRYYITSLLW